MSDQQHASQDVQPQPHLNQENTPPIENSGPTPRALPPASHFDAPPAPSCPPKSPEKRLEGRTPRQNHTPLIKETAKALVIQGLTYVRVAAELGIPVDTLKKWAKKEGWVSVRANIQARTHSAIAEVVENGLTSVGKRLRADLAYELQDQMRLLRRHPPTKINDLRDTKQRAGRAKTVKTIVESAEMVFAWEKETRVGLIVPMIGLQVPVEVSGELEQPGEQPPAPAIEIPSTVSTSDPVEPGNGA